MNCVRLILIVSLLTICGCKSKDPNPELLDPIYKFLVDQSNVLNSARDNKQKELDDALKAFEKIEVNTAERKQEMKNIQKMRGMLARLTQEAEYSAIRRDRRKVEAHRDYDLAYSKDEPWPKPGEFEAFMTQQRLRSAPRDWGHRVPKLQDRIDKAWPKPDAKAKAKEKEPPAGSEH